MNYKKLAYSITEKIARLESGAGLIQSGWRSLEIQALHTLLARVRVKCGNSRSFETARLSPGQKITSSGFPGTVVRLYSDGPVECARMYDIRLPGGVCCVCGSDIVPVKAHVQPDLLDMGAFQLA